MPTPLLRTKLYVPPLRPGLVSRPRLLERLNAGLCSSRLTLVSAPAGFGKTTCISEWVHTLGCPVAWLSLDPADDDPGRFFVYLVAALQEIDRNLGREIEGVLRAGQLPPGEAISTTLINDALQLQGQTLLVLDDFHVIQDRFILQVVEEWIAHLPQSLHLVLLTREDPPLPLARLRAGNLLTEIRAGGLRFTGDEASRFLNGAMALSLPEDDVAVLEDRTEGWIAGLQLAAIAMQSPAAQQPPQPARDRAGASAFAASLRGSHRFILSYLTEEVLSRQPEEVRRFLLQTSILDSLTGPLCDAVTGRADGHAMLQRLFKANLFLVALDGEGQWYRYHHLFADLLRDLQNAHARDETVELHRRAHRWYAQAGGERGLFVGEAIQHALAAQDYGMAVGLLERHAASMIMQGYIKTVYGWAQTIPAEWHAQSPRTNLAFAWAYQLSGAYAEASPYLEQLRATLGDSQMGRPQPADADPSLGAEWLVMQSLLLYKQGQVMDSRTLATRALELAPQEDGRVRSLAYFALASADQVVGDDSRAVESFQMAIQCARAAENLFAEMMSTTGLAALALERGQLRLAFEIASEAAARIERSGMFPPTSAVVYSALGDACYQWFQLDEARSHTLRALQLSTLGGYNTATLLCGMLLSRLLLVEGDLEAAACEIRKAADLVPLDAPDYVRQEVASCQVRVDLARGHLAAAQMALQGHGFSFQDGFSYPALPPDRRISHPAGLLYASGLRVLLHQARAGNVSTGLEPGLELADRLIAAAFEGRQFLVALEALLLRAQLHAALGGAGVVPATSLQAGQDDYVRALELAEPEGFIAVFVAEGPPVAEALARLLKHRQLGSVRPRYVERILAAFAGSQLPSAPGDEQRAGGPPAGAASPPQAALVEALTDRELEVLHLIANGLKYEEIAARLFISLNTVRFHVKSIYGKLGVNSRTQAVERARRLRML